MNFILLFLLSTFEVDAQERWVSVGQGIAAPSVYGGLEGQNPVSLAGHQGVKLQSQVAHFPSQSKLSRGAGALLLGNGLLGAGVQYAQFSRFPQAEKQGIFRYGIAGVISPLGFGLGFSAESRTLSERPTGYRMGLMVYSSKDFSLGFVAHDFTHSKREYGLGFRMALDRVSEFVTDVAWDRVSKALVVKPGLALRIWVFDLTYAYGMKLKGAVSESFLVTPGHSAGFGFALTSKVKFQYDYQILSEHRVGLTLGFN